MIDPSTIKVNMDSNEIVKIKHLNKPTEKTKSLSQPPQQVEVEQAEIGQPEQVELAVVLESLAEATTDESVCDSGWSLAQLMNEFGGR